MIIEMTKAAAQQAFQRYFRRGFDYAAGQLACFDCEGSGVWHGKPCTSCTRNKTATPPVRDLYASHHLDEGFDELCLFLGDLAARGGVELLPQRAQAIVAELMGPLGVEVARAIILVRMLEGAVENAPEAFFPGGSLQNWHRADPDAVQRVRFFADPKVVQRAFPRHPKHALPAHVEPIAAE